MTLLRIARHELRQSWRTRTVVALAAVSALLLLTATVIGVRRHDDAREQRARYQALVAEQFRDQPDRHPHRVSHYGFLVFRTPAPLGALDAGLEDHVGSTLFLEAHRQNGATFSDAAQSDSLRRMGALTVATVLQVFVPLLIFGIGGTMLTREREAGTLSLLLVQGASWRQVIAGKWLGTLAITGLVLVPGVALSSAWLLLSAGPRVDTDLLLRLLGFGLVHLAYAMTCAALAVTVSAVHRTSRGALVVLLAVWSLLWVVVPRLAPMAAATLHPLPARAEFEARVERRVRELGDSHNPDDPRFVALRQQTLARYGVTRVEDLPVNYNGLVTTEGEKLSSEAYAAHRASLESTYGRQMRVIDAAGLVSPLLAVRAASMTLAGTDLPHVLEFERQAEHYRYTLVQALNDLHTREVAHARDRYVAGGEGHAPSRQRIDRQHWQDLPLFVPTTPTLAWAVRTRPSALALASAWLALALGAVVWVARRPREVSA